MDKKLGIFVNRLCLEVNDYVISAIDSADNYIITGDEKGNLYSYEINENSTFSLSHSLNICKGKVEQIKCVPNKNQIYVLINAYLYIYTVPRLDFICDMKKLSIFKFCVNDNSSFPNRLVLITKKRRLNFFEYQAELHKLVECKIDELMCSDLPDVVEFYGDWISMVSKEKMILMNVNGTVLKQDFPITYAKNVLGSWLIYTNNLGIFMENNVAKQQNPITFNPKPLVMMGVYKTYLIALYDTLIEVYDGNDSTCLQEISTDSGTVAKMIVASGKRIFYTMTNIPDKRGNVTSCQVWELKEVAFEKQINKLLSDLMIEEALNVLNNNISSADENKPKKIEQFFIDCGWACIKKCEFKKAYQYIKLTNYNPFELVYLFTNLLSININDEEIKKKTVLNSIESIAKNDEDLINDAFKMIFDLLYDKRNMFIATYEVPKDLTKKISFISSINSLIDLSKYDYSLFQLFEFIHTTLIKIHVRNKINIKALFKLTKSNDFNCDYGSLNSFIDKNISEESKIAMAYLLERKEKYEDALKIWLEFGNKSDSNVAYSKEACERTKQILVKCKDRRLFHDYVQWILEKYPDQAFELYLKSDILDIVPVEFFFSSIIGNVEKNKANCNLKEKFLEYYIANSCQTERYHTMLLEIYIEKIFKLRKSDLHYEQNLIEGNLKYNLEKFDKLLRTSSCYNPNFILEKIQHSWLVDQEIYLYSKLNKHFEALTKLVNIGIEDQDFEKAENYCIETNSNELFAYLFQIITDNYTLAKNNAALAKTELIQKQQEGVAFIYHRQILSMLKNYGNNDQLDPFVVLQQLNGEWAITDQTIFEYLTSILKNYSHKSNQLKITKSLSEMAQLYKERDLGIVRNKAVSIGIETNCELCRKKIGTTIFCVYPNMKVYHHKCANNLNICPVTRTEFNKNIL